MPHPAPDKIAFIDNELVAGSPFVAPALEAARYRVSQLILDGGVMTCDPDGNLYLALPVGGGGSGNIDGGDADPNFGGTDPVEGGGA